MKCFFVQRGKQTLFMIEPCGYHEFKGNSFSALCRLIVTSRRNHKISRRNERKETFSVCTWMFERSLQKIIAWNMNVFVKMLWSFGHGPARVKVRNWCLADKRKGKLTDPAWSRHDVLCVPEPTSKPSHWLLSRSWRRNRQTAGQGIKMLGVLHTSLSYHEENASLCSERTSAQSQLAQPLDDNVQLHEER